MISGRARRSRSSRSTSSSPSSSDGRGSSSSSSSSSESSGPGPYSDISEDEFPPPAPKVPHPDIVAEIKTPRAPELLYSFESSGSVPVRLLEALSGACVQMRTQVLTTLSGRSRSCSTRQDFLDLVEYLLQEIDQLVKKCRKAAVEYHRTLDVGSAVVNRRKFAVYKRVAVWRDGVRMVLTTLRSQPAWDEKTRLKFWRRLLLANRNSSYCCDMVSTFSADDLIN